MFPSLKFRNSEFLKAGVPGAGARAVLFVAAGMVFLEGCSFSLQKTPEGASEGAESVGQSTSASGSSIDYARIRDQVLRPHCLSCHGREAPVLLTFEQVKANLSEIERVVLSERSMPKAGPLSAEKSAILKEWIQAGAPEVVEVPQTAPSPEASSSPDAGSGSNRPVTFAQLKEKVLDPACTSCHYPGNEDEITPLGDYENVKAVKGSLWGFTILKGTMPPKDEPGIEPLTLEQKQIISDWFIDGMHE